MSVEYKLHAESQEILFAGLSVVRLMGLDGNGNPVPRVKNPHQGAIHYPHPKPQLETQGLLAPDGTVIEAAVMKSGVFAMLVATGIDMAQVYVGLTANGVSVTYGDGTAIQAMSEEPSLDQQKADMRERLKAIYCTVRDRGVVVRGVKYGTTNDDLTEIRTQIEIMAGLPERSTRSFVTRGGIVVKDATLATVRAIYAAVLAHRDAAIQREAALAILIDDAETKKELDAINPGEGW